MTPTIEAWQAKVTAELTPGTTLEKLSTKLADGFVVAPLYTTGPAQVGSERANAGWVLAPAVAGDDPEVGRVLAEEFAGGAEAVFLSGASVFVDFEVPSGPAPRASTVAPKIGFEYTPVEILRAAFHADSQRHPWLGIDPAVVGFPFATERALEFAGPDSVPLVIDARPFEGSPADELGFALAAGLALAGHFEARGIDAISMTSRVLWTLPLGTDFLLQTAKLRALRRLWKRVLTLVSGGQAGAHSTTPVVLPAIQIRGVASTRWATYYDPWVNLLRNTAATFAGAIGGADVLTPLPYDAAIGPPDSTTRRLARNTVHLLAHESQLARVADLAAGSHAIETWTEALAAHAWALAQEVEGRGGFEAALASGFVASRVAQAREREAARVAKRQDGIVGTSLFPNLAEERPVRAAPAFQAPAPYAPYVTVPRRAEAFEHLREVGEAGGVSVLLVTLGPPADHLPRLGFARDFYGVAGIRAVEAPDDANLAAAFQASGAHFAVLCGTDQAYPDAVLRLVPALKAAGAQKVVLAGRPGDRETGYRAVGVDAYIYVGVDVLKTLERDLPAAASAAPAAAPATAGSPAPSSDPAPEAGR